MIFLAPLGVNCKFQLEKFLADGTITYRGPEFSNVVLENGLGMMASYAPNSVSYAGISWCNLGRSSRIEHFADTGLDEFITSTNNQPEDIVTDYATGAGYPYPMWRSWRHVFEFPVGSINDTVSEIGLSRLQNSDYFNRHRIVDEHSLSVRIPVLSFEGLRVWARTSIHSTVDSTERASGSFELETLDGPVTIPYEWRQLEGWLTSANIVPGRIVASDIRLSKTQTSTYNAGTAASSISVTYDADNLLKTVEATWAIDALDGDYTCLLFQNTNAPFSRFDLLSPIQMAALGQRLKLTLTRSWGRYYAT